MHSSNHWMDRTENYQTDGQKSDRINSTLLRCGTRNTLSTRFTFRVIFETNSLFGRIAQGARRKKMYFLRIANPVTKKITNIFEHLEIKFLWSTK